jgi:DNA processing protein
LFFRGDVSCLKDPENSGTKFLCVVGTRRTSQYGVDACRSIIEGLRGQNIVIISGLAIGIDTVAHEASLKAGLKTVAVLCSGLEWSSIYPRQNERLAKEIVAAGGALVSEFGDTYQPHPFNFPERNRIMAGLSHATLVIEASMKSGTLITARLALDYNRDVFAVPGSIFNEQSTGPNALITEGATVVTKSADILAAFGMAYDPEVTTKDISNLAELEKKIYAALTSPLTRAEVFEKFSGVAPAHKISSAISTLEISGHIVESGGFLRR